MEENMMRCQTLIVVGALLLLTSTAYATPISFVANLSGVNESPSNLSPATGSATVVTDPAAQTLQLTVTFSGLTSNDSAAHIHCCLPSPFAAGNIGVATAVPAFPGFPLMVTSGTYSSAVFDLTQSTIYNPGFITAQGN